MFETLFKYPRILARRRGGPAADERQRFLAHRAHEGAARCEELPPNFCHVGRSF